MSSSILAGFTEPVVDVVVRPWAVCQKSEKPRNMSAKMVGQLNTKRGVVVVSFRMKASWPLRISLSSRKPESSLALADLSCMRAAVRTVGWWSGMWLTSTAVWVPLQMSRTNVRHSSSQTVLAVRTRSVFRVG